MTGSDEHGVKNMRAAKAAGIDTQKFVDENTAAAIDLIKQLNISNDDYIRTTDRERHWPTAQDIWTKLVESGDIYKKKYQGKYCPGCEAFVKESDLVDGKCPHHNKEPEVVEEENYFFKLSKYQEQLIKILETDEYHIVPQSKKNEILSFARQGLDDVSFSRPKEILPWGIPVPGDDTHVMYVWCDALTNYLSGIGYTYDKEKFKKYWPADIHLIGKDIIRFHALFWPAMLISAKLPLPKKLLVHSFITSQGKKMSKSLGNVIDPFEQIKRYGTDSVRYFLLREIPSDDDGDYTDEALIKRHNGELANELGNLVYRVLTLAEKNSRGQALNKNEDGLEKIFLGIPEKVEEQINNFKLHHALNEAWRFVSTLNKYVNEKEPWKIKDEEELDKILHDMIDGLRLTAILLYPFIPGTCEKIFDQLGLNKKDISWDNLRCGKIMYILEKGNIKKGDVLFKKIEVNK